MSIGSIVQARHYNKAEPTKKDDGPFQGEQAVVSAKRQRAFVIA